MYDHVDKFLLKTCRMARFRQVRSNKIWALRKLSIPTMAYLSRWAGLACLWKGPLLTFSVHRMATYLLIRNFRHVNLRSHISSLQPHQKTTYSMMPRSTVSWSTDVASTITATAPMAVTLLMSCTMCAGYHRLIDRLSIAELIGVYVLAYIRHYATTWLTYDLLVLKVSDICHSLRTTLLQSLESYSEFCASVFPTSLNCDLTFLRKSHFVSK